MSAQMGGDPVGRVLGGRYRVDSLIAKGGMAAVYEASDDVLKRTVAVKILHDHLSSDDGFLERFRMEALAAAGLTHPNIVSIYDTGSDEGSPFIVMERLAGPTLAGILADKRQLDPEQVARFAEQVCAALAYAHENGVIHRDIKPANILFTENGIAKVGDFGIAKAAFSQDLTTTGAVLGTIRYISPEQVEGAEPGPRSDLFSLGVVMYEALTGRSPYTGETDLALAMARLRETPPRPRDIRPDIPRWLDSIVMSALSTDPDERPENAQAMATSLGGASPPSTLPPVNRGTAADQGPPTEEVSFVKTEGRWLVPTLVLVLAAAALVAVVLRYSDEAQDAIEGLLESTGEQPRLTISDVGTYDPRPDGDGSENNDELGRLHDGDKSSYWGTQWYATADFGQLKDGVGVFVDLGKAVEADSIKIISVTAGWQGSLRYSDDGRTWSEPGSPRTMQREETLGLEGSHRYWMVWITRLVRTDGEGDGDTPYSVGIAELEVR